MPCRSRSSSTRASAGRLGALLAALAAAGAPGCGAEDDSPRAPPAVILAEPSDAAAFEGQSAVFRVAASGTAGLTYQWRRDGAAIPGATDSHVATPPLAPGDDGAIYSVAVANADAAPVESRGARLTVHPPVDLRFQWVNAPFTPSYAVGGDIFVGLLTTYVGAGTPLVTPGFCGGVGSCVWYYGVDPTIPGMTIAYENGSIQDLGPAWAAPLPADGVVTSLDVQEASGVYAWSLSRTTQAGEFTPVVQGSVLPDELQAVVSSEAAQGRVLTAVSFRGGRASYVSHGWSRAPSAVYEARVVATPFATLRSAAETLAAQGYVITACGAGDGGANGFLLVGTRAQGDSAPRAIAFGTNVAELRGFAIVAFVGDPASGDLALVGER
jgi:hypothetical protein